MKIKIRVPKSKAVAAPTEDAWARSIISPPQTSPESITTPVQSSPGASFPRFEQELTPSSPNMAPVAQNDQKVVEDQLRDVIQDLYQIMVQVNSYDQAKRPSKDILEHSIKQLHESLQKVHHTASSPSSNLSSVPQELVQYVDSGRNPDIYTREFVEGARRSNQMMKGKMEAFGSFRDVLAAEMAKGLPELKEDIGKVLEETGGRRGVVLEEDP